MIRAGGEEEEKQEDGGGFREFDENKLSLWKKEPA